MFASGDTFTMSYPSSKYKCRKHRDCQFTEPESSKRATINSSSLARLQYVIRQFQNTVFCKKEPVLEDTDKVANAKWEMALQPPTMEELQKSVGNVFDAKWIKYIYAHFKNECPSGKMRLSAFKNLFYPHLPEGVSDEYIQRLFFAFSFGECEVTFESLLETLAMLKTSSALTNAKWTMRLISGSETKPVSYEDFENFVKSIFIRNTSGRNTGSKSISIGFEERLNLDKIVEKRAKNRFAILDRNDDGLIEVDELVEFFKGEGGVNVQRLTGPKANAKS